MILKGEIHSLLKVVKGIDDFKDYFSKHSKMSNDDTHVSRSNDLALTVAKMKIEQHDREEWKRSSCFKLVRNVLLAVTIDQLSFS